SPMGDQIAAAGVMMVEESLLTIGLFCWLFLKVAREAEERQQLLDAAAERGLELDERRAARAVAAGRGPELWERLTAGHSPPGQPTPADSQAARPPHLHNVAGPPLPAHQVHISVPRMLMCTPSLRDTEVGT